MSDIKIKSKNLNVYYGDKQALFDVNLDLNEKEVTALIGPSGCGKSTFIRCINRMNDVIDICKVEGNIEIDGIEVNDKELDVVSLRERVGMVFQKPNPFPKSIYDNISYGPKIHGKGETKTELDEIVVTARKKAESLQDVPLSVSALRESSLEDLGVNVFVRLFVAASKCNSWRSRTRNKYYLYQRSCINNSQSYNSRSWRISS